MMLRTSSVLILLTLTTYSGVGNCEQNVTTTESVTNTRSGRQLDIPRDVRFVRIFLDQHQHLRRPPQILARSDHFPQRIGPGPGPGPYGRPQFNRPPLQPPMPHIRRRVHTGPPGPPPSGMFFRHNVSPQFNNYQTLKNTRYPLAKSPYIEKGVPINYYRQGQGPVTPNVNAIPQASNFKPSPVYNGEVIVRQPTAASLVAAAPSIQIQKQKQQQLHLQEQDEERKNLQQYKPQTKRPESDSNHMYSVYEDTDVELQNFADPNIGESAMKEAKQYLNFMSSSDYFLPKIQPDYRKMDQAKQQQLQLQQQAQSAALSAYQQQQQQLQLQQQQQRNSGTSSLNAAFTVNAPLRVSASASTSIAPQVQVQSVNPISSPTSTYSNRHPAKSNLGSYQSDGNVFVVGSDGAKSIHQIMSTSSYPEISFQQQTVPSFSSALRPVVKERISDPERVEFTERDAIHVSYTSNPMDSMTRYNDNQHHHQQQQQHHQSQQQQIHQPQADRRYVKSTAMPEEDDEMLIQAASDVYGRVKVNINETIQKPNSEQKDTEEYCERICSNIQDEDEEIVCGSDGYMYTSEAQMECYASCLHIDVTIQSKGTCNQAL